ncbi:membrane protein insertion efficiency factor YidD [Vibrio brasiliensis]|nr:membrane protein insertion efficiency factor YidD [Vibrio brasiliensis]MCG9647952.1 membrane protein insertion efficiency factor YidD [Vibrio brasiliensis]
MLLPSEWRSRLVWFSIRLVYLYSLLAPVKLRQACLFEPSCSEYAILALRKYGLVIGWRLTINRLTRCKQPNVGNDYP